MKSPAKLTKLELARLKERFQGSNPTRHFNVRLEKAWRGRVILSMPVQGRHKQILNTVHGGVLALLVDTAGGLAAFLASPMDARVVTIELKINFMEAVERGVLTADAIVLRQGRTVSVVDCSVTDEDERLVSKALMTFAVVAKR